MQKSAYFIVSPDIFLVDRDIFSSIEVENIGEISDIFLVDRDIFSSIEVENIGEISDIFTAANHDRKTAELYQEIPRYFLM